MSLRNVAEYVEGMFRKYCAKYRSASKVLREFFKWLSSSKKLFCDAMSCTYSLEYGEGTLLDFTSWELNYSAARIFAEVFGTSKLAEDRTCLAIGLKVLLSSSYEDIEELCDALAKLHELLVEVPWTYYPPRYVDSIRGTTEWLRASTVDVEVVYRRLEVKYRVTWSFRDSRYVTIHLMTCADAEIETPRGVVKKYRDDPLIGILFEVTR